MKENSGSVTIDLKLTIFFKFMLAIKKIKITDNVNIIEAVYLIFFKFLIFFIYFLFSKIKLKNKLIAMMLIENKGIPIAPAMCGPSDLPSAVL